mgnify:CR=1 FL=1
MPSKASASLYSLPTPLSSKSAVDALNSVMVDGMEVVSFKLLPETVKNAMASVAAADYFVNFREGYAPENWEEKFMAFLQKEEMLIVKKTKRSEAEVDLKPMLYKAEIRDGGIFMQVACGSVNNLKPELVMEAFAKDTGTPLAPFALEVCRLEVYADLGDETTKKLIPLEELGEDIES